MKQKVKLPLNISEKLQKLPESGMGYQVVDLILKDGKIVEKVTVLNSLIAILEVPLSVLDIVDVKLS